MTIKSVAEFYNTLSRTKESFAPIDPENIRMYVCGPTVYDHAHIGNARPIIVFDVLFRLLRTLYGSDKVTYARNITDVDDKINARALRDYPDLSLNDAIHQVTEKTIVQFHADIDALGCLEPTFEPRATQHVDGMIKMIETLISKNHAYQAGGEVLFDISSMAKYGGLSNRKLDEQQAGARVATSEHKRNPGDFVLWKQSSDQEPGWPSPWGRGRPGWHIECSVMSQHHLGDVFDIHGGGLDLIFPHHENEIAQSCCANNSERMANIWMHNGFLQVEGKKMSKSDGNFVTINELLHTDKFGAKKWAGPVLRLAMLMTHYREPIDFCVRRLEEAENMIAKWPQIDGVEPAQCPEVMAALSSDLNTVRAVKELQSLAQSAKDDPQALASFAGGALLLGLTPPKPATVDFDTAEIEAQTNLRLSLLADKDWAAADAIRDALLAKGIQLKDAKDPDTGERTTTWEAKR